MQLSRKIVPATLGCYKPQWKYRNGRTQALWLAFLAVLSLMCFLANIYKVTLAWVPPGFSLGLTFSAAMLALIKDYNYRTYWRSRRDEPSMALIKWADKNTDVEVWLKPFAVELEIDCDGGVYVVIDLSEQGGSYLLVPHQNGEVRGWRKQPLAATLHDDGNSFYVMSGLNHPARFDLGDYLRWCKYAYYHQTRPSPDLPDLLKYLVTCAYEVDRLDKDMRRLENRCDHVTALALLLLDIISDRDTVGRSSLLRDWRVKIAHRLAGRIGAEGDNHPLYTVMKRAQSADERKRVRLFPSMSGEAAEAMRQQLLDGDWQDLRLAIEHDVGPEGEAATGLASAMPR